VTGGWGSDVPIGDVNNCLESFNNNKVFDYLRKANSDRIAGEIKTLDDSISHWEAELRFDLTSRISLGIATSAPFHTFNESSVTYTYIGWAGSQIMTWTFKPEIKVSYPVRLSAYYNLTFIPRLNISIGGGVGFYSATIKQLLRFDITTPLGISDWVTWNQEVRRTFSLGYHGNVVMEYFLTNRLAVVVEYQRRYVRINKLKGTIKKLDGAGISTELRGILYYLTMWDPLIGTRYATIEVFPGFPEDPFRWLEDIREARLDLGSDSIRIGVRVRLF
jgi:hypothetical protein